MKTLRKLVRLEIDWTEESWRPKISFAPFGVPVPRVSPLPTTPVNHRCHPVSITSGNLLSSRGSRGFTLVELLVVIGIIAILASIALPVIAAFKKNAKKQIASAEMANLIAAINAYESEYSRPPAFKLIEDMLNGLPDADYTFGAVDVAGNTVGNTKPGINSAGQQYTNNVVMNIILDRDDFPNNVVFPGGSPGKSTRNPRHVVTFQAKRSSGPGIAGVDDKGVLRDPWGNPYIITLDMNDDNKCDDPVYGIISAPVAVWSAGPDGNYLTKRDNIVSWK